MKMLLGETKKITLYVILCQRDGEKLKKEIYAHKEDRDLRAIQLKRFDGQRIHVYLTTEEYEELEI